MDADERGRDGVGAGGLTVRVSRAADGPSVIVAGRVTVDSSPRLRSALHEVIRDATKTGVTIDMAATSYLDSSGIATLLEASTIASRRGVPLRVVGLSGEPRYLAEVTDLGRIFRALGSELEVR
jgi:anti-anti-sigma factor